MSTSWITENVTVIKAFYSQLLQKKSVKIFEVSTEFQAEWKESKILFLLFLDSTGCDYKTNNSTSSVNF